MRALVIVVVLAAIVGLGYWAVMVRTGVQEQAAVEDDGLELPYGDDGLLAGYEVVYENGAFSPAALEVSVGATVTFTNKHTANIRIPSGPHPVHTSYPDFDSDTLAPGESYDFTFIEPMTLKYHNHFNPDAKGQVIVK